MLHDMCISRIGCCQVLVHVRGVESDVMHAQLSTILQCKSGDMQQIHAADPHGGSSMRWMLVPGHRWHQMPVIRLSSHSDKEQLTSLASASRTQCILHGMYCWRYLQEGLGGGLGVRVLLLQALLLSVHVCHEPRHTHLQHVLPLLRQACTKILDRRGAPSGHAHHVAQ